MLSRLAKITLFLLASGVFFFASDQVAIGQSAQCCSGELVVSLTVGSYKRDGGFVSNAKKTECKIPFSCSLLSGIDSTVDNLNLSRIPLLGTNCNSIKENLISSYVPFFEYKNGDNLVDASNLALNKYFNQINYLVNETKLNRLIKTRNEKLRAMRDAQELAGTRAVQRATGQNVLFLNDLFYLATSRLGDAFVDLFYLDQIDAPDGVNLDDRFLNELTNIHQYCKEQFDNFISDNIDSFPSRSDVLIYYNKNPGRDVDYHTSVPSILPAINLEMYFQKSTISCTANNMCREALGGYTENCRRLSNDECTAATAQCRLYRNNCYSAYDPAFCSVINEPDVCNSVPVCAYNPSVSSCLSKLESGLIGNQTSESAVLPKCALAGSCRSVEDLLVTAVRLAKEIFGVIGAAAFAMFVYGGGLMVASFGNEERFGKGKQVLTAAVIGLIVAFSAYLLVGYVLSLFEVGPSFNIYEIDASL